MSDAEGRPEPGVALVVGGSSAIGGACSDVLDAAGWRVVVTSTSGRPVGDRLTVPCDVADAGSVDDAVARVEEEAGVVEAVVFNAGITDDGLLLSMTDDRFARVVDVNLVGARRVTDRVLPGMVERGRGALVYVSSVAGMTGSPGQVNYATSKAGLIGLARAVALASAPAGVRANVVAPGPVGDTGIIDRLNDSQRQALLGAVPMGRLATPREVAEVVVFLLSPGAGYVTGALVPIDGGMTITA